jgi:hypothetical protein
MARLKKWSLHIVLALVVVGMSFLLPACGDNGLPKQPGEYGLQPKSLTYDGQDYSFSWVDKDKSVHPVSIANLKMVQGERSFLEMKDGEPILHLTPQDSITVKGEDQRGSYQSPWFPFMAGAVAGHMLSNPYPGSPYYDDRSPTYRYPPSGSFGRDDTLHGNITTNKPATPDYGKVAANPNAVSGATGGTGGGTAATSKSGAITAAGAAGGTGAGTAASSKGGFKSGTSSYSATIGAASAKKVGGGSSVTGSGGSKSSPSSSGRPSGSRGSSGGRSGGK